MGSSQGDDGPASEQLGKVLDHRRDQARAFLVAASGNEEYPFADSADLDALIYGLYAPLWLALLIGHEAAHDETRRPSARQRAAPVGGH